MVYQLNRFNREFLVNVDDGSTESNTTSLTFVGKNFAGYGGIQNENFLYLLENFASGSEPPHAIAGQIWYDSTNKKLKFYVMTGPTTGQWNTTGGSYVSSTAPTNTLNTGDFWYDTSTHQLKAWDSDKGAYVLIGPQSVVVGGQTNLESANILDSPDGNPHAIVKAVANGHVVFVISNDTFTLQSASNTELINDGFSYIRKGITLPNTPGAGLTNEGVTSSTHRLWGTASNADKLDNLDSSAFILAASASFTGLAGFPDAGIVIGSPNNDIKIYIDSGKGTIKNTYSKSLYFRTTDASSLRTPLILDGYDVYPGDTDTYNLGTASNRWNTVRARTVYADSFEGPISGIAAKSDTLYYARSSLAGASKYSSATDQNTGNTIVARDVSGNFSANVISATATQARYADLAEKYDSDAVYEPGTVVIFGGEKEITVTDIDEDTRVAGVISTDPAYLMNVESDGLAVALRGKVPCKVIGPINKGDVLVSSTTPGYARRGNVLSPAACIIGKSLENKIDSAPGVIMVVVI